MNLKDPKCMYQSHIASLKKCSAVIKGRFYGHLSSQCIGLSINWFKDWLRLYCESEEKKCLQCMFLQNFFYVLAKISLLLTAISTLSLRSQPPRTLLSHLSVRVWMWRRHQRGRWIASTVYLTRGGHRQRTSCCNQEYGQPKHLDVSLSHDCFTWSPLLD